MDMNIRGDSFTFKGEPYNGYPCVWQIYMNRNYGMLYINDSFNCVKSDRKK